MSFSQIQILGGIFSSSSLFSQTSKLPLNPPAQFTMLKPFSQGSVISRLSHWSFLPSRLLPSSPPVHLSRVTYLLCHPQILLLPSQCSSHQSLLFSHSAPCTTSFLLTLSTSPSFPFHPGPPQLSQETICSSLSSNLIPEFLVYARNLIRLQFSTRSELYLLCLWVSLVLSHFATSK